MITTATGIVHLAREIEQALAVLSRRTTAMVHVKQEPGSPALAACDVWVVHEGQSSIWSRHRALPAGLGLTMRQVEHAVVTAGHDFARGSHGLRGAWLSPQPNTHLLRLRRG